MNMGKKEEFAKIFSSESKLPSMQLLRELSFMAGWDSCMKYLATLPLDEAISEIVKHIKAKHSDMSNSSNESEV